jgi:hypothetical protein
MVNMRKSITQELDYGCGVACFAFVCNMTFREAVSFLGREYSVRHGWKPSDLIIALQQYGLNYKNSYVRKKSDYQYPDNTIVLIERSTIERSTIYPVGHYIVFFEGRWMDPWINMPENSKLESAESGFRIKIPGKAMYALILN